MQFAKTAIAPSRDLETEKYIENSSLICSILCASSGKVMWILNAQNYSQKPNNFSKNKKTN